MEIGFLSTTIKRVSRRRLFWHLFFLVGIFTSASCMLLFFWLAELKELVPYITISAGALIIGGVILRMTFIFIRNIQNPFESFYFNDLKYLGPLAQTIAQIDQEAAPYVGVIGSFATKHWVISAQSNSFNLLPLQDVVWVYKQVHESRVSFYHVPISTGRTYAAKIWNRFGFCMTVLSSEEGINRLLRTIKQNAPWVTLGYTEYLFAAWERNRMAFITEVDKRRKQTLLEGDSAIGINKDPVIETLPGGKPPFEFDLNHPLVRDGIQEAKNRRNFNLRARGFLFAFIGLIGSMLCIVLPVLGMLNREKGISISKEGVVLSLIFLIIGVYNAAFGSKGMEFYEKIIGNSTGRLVFSYVLFGAAVLFVYFGLDVVVKFLGYEVTSSLVP